MISIEPGRVRVEIDSAQHAFDIAQDERFDWVGPFAFPRVSRYPASESAASAETASSPMPGKVLRILATRAREVQAGDPLVVLGSDENGADHPGARRGRRGGSSGDAGTSGGAGRNVDPNSSQREGIMTQAVAEQSKTEFPYFGEEHRLIRDTVKKFALAEIKPHSAEWDEAEEFPVDLFKSGAALGLFGIRLDPEWGGSGLDWWATAAYIEGMSYTENGGVNMAFMVQSDITLPALEELGTREQMQEFMKPAIAGDYIASLGISEPGGGSDVAAMTTHARIDGGDLLISGTEAVDHQWRARGFHHPGRAHRRRRA